MTPTILICDDELHFAHAIGRELESRGVEVVLDTESNAVQLARQLQPSAILLDLLQRRDGLALLKELKAEEATREIPTVVMSGVFAPEEPAGIACAGAMAMGAFTVVPKPFPDGFLDRLVALARTPMSERGPRLVVVPAGHDVELDIEVTEPEGGLQ